MLARVACLALFLLLAVPSTHGKEPSVCFGTTASGRLENGWNLPSSGPNFAIYSTVGHTLGRAYVHSTVHAILLDVYATLETTMPDTVYVIGETGKKNGGVFKPHKTHRNGLSVDFMVPVVDENGKSVKLPGNVFNKWGYDLEFDSLGKLDELRVNAEAMSEHIYELHRSAKRNGVDIWRVIFDPALQPLLHKTDRWSYLSDNVQFSTKPSWVRHDEHYHIDFLVPCNPDI